MSGPWERLAAAVRGLTPKGGTAERAIKGVVWVFSQNVAGRVLQLALLVILARAIGPTAIGIVGVALLVLSAMESFTKVGLNAALIHNENENVDSYLDTVWLLETGRGLLIGTVVFVSAGAIAVFFDEPRAVRIVQTMALSPVLYGLRNPGVVYLQKHLEFHKQFLYRVGTDVVRFVAGLAALAVTQTAWAYVAAFLVARFAQTAFSYVIHDYRPWPRFDREAAAELVDYGKWITGTSIVQFLYSEGDDVFVGWLLTPAALAFYQYAYRFSNAPATEFTQVVSSVMFPALSQIQDDTDQLREAFLDTLRMTALVAFPAGAGIAAVAPTFVRGLLGPDWTPMVPAMQVLAVYGLLRALGKVFGPTWKAVGRPDIVTKVSLLRVGLIVVAIYPLTAAFGITGTAITVTAIYVFPMMPLDVFVMARVLEMDARRIAYEFWYPLAASVVMFLVVRTVRLELAVAPLVELPVQIAVGVVTYATVVAAVETRVDWGVRPELARVVSNVRK